ncbi:MAG TPA: O-acetyl-ADP-ribose deacetylase [Dictyobacter sp.]|jgi:O-acetyl-ADP-ribose deacetylase (regulator of RNase III)|nr:O-acetyl-ADP-ribose deacetylase [Dictyobacter sp.]
MFTAIVNDIPLTLLQGNIVTIQTDAIVNAANSALSGGGGVDGAIHRAGGPTILQECRQLGRRCPTGSAVATTAGKLQARYVFHAVGPVYTGNDENEARLLTSAYQSCLHLAEQHQIQSIAFPSISTGIYGYPLDLAAPIALNIIITHLQQPTTLQQVMFVLFDQRTYKTYQQTLQRLLAPS